MDLDYLFYYFLYKQRMVAEEVESGSRPRITIEHLERLPIPIPPGEKEEEARIVKQIEARLSEVEQGYKYVTDTQQEIVRTFYGVIQNVFRIERIDRWPRQNLNNLVENVQKEISPQAAEFDYPYIDGSDIEPCRGELKAHHTWRDRQTSVEQAVLLDPAHNIVLYVRASPDKRRAILLKADQALCAPALLPLRVKEHQRDKLLPGFLLWSLLSEPFLTFVSPRHKKAAPVRSSTPSVGKVLSYHLPLPDIDTQKEIITKLNRVQEITHAMHTKADDSRNLFATVERAILQKAFQGEL